MSSHWRFQNLRVFGGWKRVREKGIVMNPSPSPCTHFYHKSGGESRALLGTMPLMAKMTAETTWRKKDIVIMIGLKIYVPEESNSNDEETGSISSSISSSWDCFLQYKDHLPCWFKPNTILLTIWFFRRWTWVRVSTMTRGIFRNRVTSWCRQVVDTQNRWCMILQVWW